MAAYNITPILLDVSNEEKRASHVGLSLIFLTLSLVCGCWVLGFNIKAKTGHVQSLSLDGNFLLFLEISYISFEF